VTKTINTLEIKVKALRHSQGFLLF